MSALNQARKAFDRIYQLSKEPVTVKVVTLTRSAQDDDSYTSVSYSTYAKVERGALNHVEPKGGAIATSDYAFYFPYDFTTGIDALSGVGNHILYLGNEYKIEKIQPFNLIDGLVYTKVYASQSNITA